MTTRRTESLTGELPPGGEPGGEGFLLPGAVIGDGRYRLLAQFGHDMRANAHMWRARDGQLRRDVALTVLVGDPQHGPRAQAARRTLERAAHAAAFTHPAAARVLDVLSLGNGVSPGEGLLGIVVADWSTGTDLTDVIAEHPLPAGSAARLLEPLAAAVERAHHAGLVLGVDHPQRIRVGTDGMLRLAFPGPLPDAVPRDDVKGLGAILYLLMTGRWPLPGGPDVIPSAPVAPDGSIVPPHVLAQFIPPDLSTVAIRSLEDTQIGGIHTSATLLAVLEEAAQSAERTEFLGAIAVPVEETEGAPVWTTRPPVRDKARRRKLAVGVTALAIAVVAILAWLGTLLIDFFGEDSVSGGDPVVVEAPTPTDGNEPPPAPKPAGPIQPASIEVFNVGGTPDNPDRAGFATDGDPGTEWRTDTYQQQFPALKPGVGLMAAFAESVRFSSVVIDSPSPNTVVQIRSAPSAEAELDETKVIGEATLQGGKTEIKLANAEPGQYILVWITQLGEGNKSALGEVRFIRAE
ncbi:protein kinase family protein [Actinophytocola glycyrrhizae]|uniref:Protein kinase family protein n=1 Tax=Actinophytocola glycyrrhizae TaxID=2044873 RepID=A0ABV9S1T5_9PSEU